MHRRRVPTRHSLLNGVLIGLGVGAAEPGTWYLQALCANEGGQNCPDMAALRY